MSSPANLSCDDMSTWTSLPADLVLLVGWRVLAGDMVDYVRFRAVCAYWRSATVCPRGHGIVDPRFHPHRWMMLPEEHGLHPSDDGDKRRFFNLSTGAFVRPRLVLLRDHRVISATAEGLLLLGRQQGDAVAIRLLHPFTGDTTDLPPLESPMGGEWRCRLETFLYDKTMTVCLSSPAGVDGVTTVMLVLPFVAHVLFATIGDTQWSYSSWIFPPSRGVVPIQGKLYMVRVSKPPSPPAQQIFQIGAPHQSRFGQLSLPPPKAIATCPRRMRGPFDLVEHDSEILVIAFSNAQHSTELLVYRVGDLILDKVIPVTNIGGKTIFLDIARNISPNGYHPLPDLGRTMTASHRVIPTMEGDTIVRRHLKKRFVGEHLYQLDPGERYVAQYHLGSGAWTPTASGLLKDPCGLQCVCGLVFHIYGHCCCASRRYTRKIQSDPGWRSGA